MTSWGTACSFFWTKVKVHAESWPQAMGIQAAPANVGVALALHYSLMDDIWHLCGDKATDLSW